MSPSILRERRKLPAGQSFQTDRHGRREPSGWKDRWPGGCRPGSTIDELLEQQPRAGLNARLAQHGELTEERRALYEKRLQHEIEVIENDEAGQ